VSKDHPPVVLLADDQGDVIEALRLLLKGEGFQSDAASSPAGVLAAIESRDYDAVLMDLNYTRDTTSGKEGMDLLAKITAIDATLPVIVMTAWGSLELAVEAMRRGARDFIQKPWENERLVSVLRTQISLGQALRQGQRLEAENRMLRQVAGDGGVTVIAESPAMRPVLDVIARVGPSDANVLITGEHGTGKGVVAAALHAASRRASRPVVTVNTGGLPEGVFESELFGHVKGAFTGANRDSLGFIRAANGGTLFLDEIGELTPQLQAKFLRVLQEKCVVPVGDFRPQPVDIRVLSATNRPLDAMVREGTFRQDLYFRLNVVVLQLPPLREREGDIIPLAEHFLKTQADLYNEQVKTISPEAGMLLQDYTWPGNVRELSNVMEHAHVIAAGPQVTVADLPPRLQTSAEGEAIDDMSLQEMERSTIAKALKKANYNKAAAARLLGINIQRLNRRIIRLGIRLHGAE